MRFKPHVFGSRWCTWFGIVLLAMPLLVTLIGCRTGGARSGDSLTGTPRDTQRAYALTAEANELMHSDPDRATSLLLHAVEADLFHGPAHNNLGVLYLQRDALYDAAREFEWARKLMPGHPDPRMNLAMTLERAGRIDEAITTYRAALEVYSGHIPTLQALTRAEIQYRQAQDDTADHLRIIALEGETPEWRDWARQQLLRLEGRERDVLP
jgi:tetratricopeptide (TPR) repeat protein